MTSPRLTAARCRLHPEREAAARCRDCERFFCRECVTEHDEKLLCARCLAARGRRQAQGSRRLVELRSLAPAALGLLLAWSCFYGAARLLLLIPTSFHEGTVWSPAAPPAPSPEGP